MLKSYEILQSCGVERCRECKCALGDDWEYVDFTAKSVIKCPQCGELYYLEELKGV
jgi:predicted  nucleic acid-binding Zn-ribbon protein